MCQLCLLFVFMLQTNPVPVPMIVAHRGASFDAPENTLAAFKLAWEQGSDAAEGDFHLSKDGKIVCIHEKDTKRVAGKKLVVAESTFDELRQLDVGSWKDKRFANERIPTLEEVLDLLPKGKVFYIEIKCGPEIIKPLKEVLTERNLTPEQIVFISFNRDAVAAARKELPQFKSYWLTSFKENKKNGRVEPTIQQVIKTLKELDASGLDCRAHDCVDAQFVAELRKAGFDFHVWTVNDGPTARRFQELGVRSITTDRPAYLRAALESQAKEGDPWVVYEGSEGPLKGKHIVIVTGDEEYRSEEGMPVLAKILAKHHGAKCTVLFAIDKKDGTINPQQLDNIPGLENLKTADLMVLFVRFRNLPEEQMKHIVDYVNSGKPIVALRTSTHAFAIPKDSKYAKYDWRNRSKEFQGGFGRQILGETWVAHYGRHQVESTRGVIAKGMEKHPIARGLDDIWGPSDVYAINSLTGDSQPIVMGQVLKGMSPKSQPRTDKKLVPIAWIKTYTGEDGKTNRIFTTTMGHGGDLANEGVRRMLVNGAYWCLGKEDQIPERANVDLVGEYNPTPIGVGGHRKGVRPSDLK